MTDINNVFMVGRLTKNAEFRQLGGGSQVASLSVALNKSKKVNDQWEDEVSYIDVQAFGRLAENMQGRLYKGTQVTISGYLKQDRWQSSGEQRSRLLVVANDIVPHEKKEQVNGF